MVELNRDVTFAINNVITYTKMTVLNLKQGIYNINLRAISKDG